MGPSLLPLTSASSGASSMPLGWGEAQARAQGLGKGARGCLGIIVEVTGVPSGSRQWQGMDWASLDKAWRRRENRNLDVAILSPGAQGPELWPTGQPPLLRAWREEEAGSIL